MEKRRKNRIILKHRYRDSRFRRKKTGSSQLEKCIILVYFGLMLTAEVSNMTHMTFYLGVVIASMIHRQRESEDLYEVANSQ